MYTPETAYSYFAEIAGGTFEYLSGPKAGQSASVNTYKVSKDGETLYILMSDGNSIPFRQFEENMIQIGAMSSKDPLSANRTPVQPEPLESMLGLMSEEEEIMDNERRTGKRSHEKKNKNPEIDKSDTISSRTDTGPISILLDNRKQKPIAMIPVNIPIIFMDASMYTLIDQSFEGSTENIIEYFKNSVDIEDLKAAFEKSLVRYIKDEFDIPDDEPQQNYTPDEPQQESSDVELEEDNLDDDYIRGIVVEDESGDNIKK